MGGVDNVSGFGWNCYGFFIYSVLWVGGYFLWVHLANRRPREEDRQSRHT
jgi:hypothetical protein